MKCFILAGGKSRRFGEDKLLYEFRGRKVIERVLEVTQKVCDEVFIVTKNPKKFKFLNVPIIIDVLPVQASMVGLYTALSYTKEPALILSGDLPLLSPEVLKKLINAYQEPVTLVKTKDKVHTLVGIYSPKVLKTIEKFLEEENYKLYELVRKEGFKALKLNEKEAVHLLNLNTKQDLRILEELEVN